MEQIAEHTGKAVASGRIKSKHTTINPEQLPAGLYLIRIDGMQQSSIKLINE